jgi:hypothetical protein
LAKERDDGEGAVVVLLYRCPCAGLRWAAQGRYRSSFERVRLAAVADAYGLTDYREPLPRHSWDPRAVSDPWLIANEFPDQFQRASSLQYRS